MSISQDADPESSISYVVDCFLAARSVIFKHCGYVENWRKLPIEDGGVHFWSVDKHENDWAKFSPNSTAATAHYSSVSRSGYACRRPGRPTPSERGPTRPRQDLPERASPVRSWHPEK
jgi:hypothetical protein